MYTTGSIINILYPIKRSVNLQFSSKGSQFLGRRDVDTEQGHHVWLHVELENDRTRK